MKRTISKRLETIKEESKKLLTLREAFLSVCNQLTPTVMENRCWNRIALHNLSYSKIRASSPLGSQMVCNAIFAVCAEANGVRIAFVNPAYSSQTCSCCGALGVRERHTFKCSCGNQQHSDLNASRNLCRFALSLGSVTCAVNRTHVAARS